VDGMKSFSKMLPQTRAPNVQQINKLIQLIDSNQLSEALLLTQNILEKDPKHSFAWKANGLILHKQNKSFEAISSFEQAIKLNNHDCESIHNIGKIYFEKYDLTSAQTYFQKTLLIDPHNLDALQGLSQCLFGQGKFRENIDLIKSNFKHIIDGNFPIQFKKSPKGFDHPHNEKLMWETLAILAQSGVHAFPIAGTLLGLIREGKLLSFDKDLDFGLPYPEMNQASQCLIENSWVKLPNQTNMLNPRSFMHVKTGMVLDLCGFFKEEPSNKIIGGFWHKHVSWDEQRLTEFPSNFSLKKKQTAIGSIWELAHPEEWLEALYGNWKIPDPDFDTVCFANNLRSYSLMVQTFAMQHLFKTWVHGNFKKALRIAQSHLLHFPEDQIVLDVEKELKNSLHKITQ
jgi:tetratricopeptide (TPR) repeat protein